MRHARFVLLVASLLAPGAMLSGCNESGPAGVYAYIEWKVRCDRSAGMSGCSDRPDRYVDGFDGEGANITCNVTETSSERILSFSANTAEYGIQLQNARFARGSSAATPGGCTVVVTDDNSYRGACGGGPPTEMQPCQVNNVSFGRDDAGRALIRGNIYCEGISPTAAPIRRNLTGPGNTLEDRMRPLTFDIYDCPGYQPD